MEIEISEETKKKIKTAINLVKEHDLLCVQFFYWGHSLLCNEERIEETEFRGMLYFKVYDDTVYLIAEHKRNGQCIIESEAFTITDDMKITLFTE